jgi:hypothetical protein
MSERRFTLHIAVPELRGMLPGAATTVSTSFWVPLAEFVLKRSRTYEVVCKREDRDPIKLLMPYAETVERRHEDGALAFWGSVNPAIIRVLTGGHGSGHEALWWWQVSLTCDGEQIFVLEDYGEHMDAFGLTEAEAALVVELRPFTVRTSRTVEGPGSG